MKIKMNLYQYLEDRIEETKIQEFKGDEYELALIRYVLMLTSKLFCRSQTFFLNDEQLEQRHIIYSRKINPENITSFEIVCLSYCALLKEVLEIKYGLKTELIPTDHDVFQHIALLLTTKTGNRYFIDPLMDLSEMKAGMRTHNFASKEQSNNPYMKVKIENLSFLSSETLEEIDKKIGYTTNQLYTDDLLSTLKSKLNPFQLVCDFFELIRKKITVNGIVDSIIYVKSALKKILSEEEKNKIKITDFFIDECDLKDDAIRYIVDNSESRKRGLVLEYDNQFIIFSPSTTEYLKLTQEDWEEKRKNNHIFVRNSEFINLYHYLNELDLEPNLLNHREFLRVFSKLEKKMIRDGKNPKDFIHVMDREKIIINYGSPLEFSIENNLLVLFNKGNNRKFAIDYGDEGRNIKYNIINQV